MRPASAAFVDLVSGPESDIALDRACLLVAAHVRPDLDVTAHLARLDDLAASCPAPTREALVEHLYGTEGFHGDEDDYYSPDNSCLDQVLARRAGIPITLGVVLMEVGRRLGLRLAGVGLPGHFLVVDRDDPDTFVDPFLGVECDAEGAEAAFHRVQGPDLRFDPSYLRAVGTRAVLARVLGNLKGIYLRAGAERDVAWVLGLRVAIPGVPHSERAEYAAALANLGDLGNAARQLDLVADLTGGRDDLRSAALRLRARLN